MRTPAQFAAFADARRPVQDRARGTLEGSVRWALHRYHKDENWDRTLVNAAERLMRRIYRTEAGRLTSVQFRQFVETFRTDVRHALDQTSATTSDNFEGKVKAITAWLTNAAINAGTEAAGMEPHTDPGQPDQVKTWITMHDERVRPAHAEVDGVTVPMEEKFSVGGVLMSRPGDPSAPPDLTINCRCVLAVDAVLQTSTGEQETATLEQTQGEAMTTVVMEPTVTTGPADDLEAVNEDDALPWHGVLAPEDTLSGDGRKFGPDALRWRDLPLPLAWQKINAAGHDGSVVVGRIDEVWREGNLIKASGIFIPGMPEADEAIGLIANGGIRGVSVDVDDATMELQNADGTPYDMEMASEKNLPVTVFPDGRICGATLCPIPAFAEAFVSLGDWTADTTDEAMTAAACDCEAFVSEENWDGSASNYTDEQYYRATIVHLVDSGPDRLKKSNNKLPILTPSGQLSRAGVHAAASRLNQTDAPPEKISRAKAALRSAYKELKEEPPDAIKATDLDVEEFEAEFVKTEDGPGWLTHPVDTERLRRYWTKGKGAAKIRWGTPGDFNRCRMQLAKYVKAQYLNGYCANRHYDATGFWPGKAPLERGRHEGETVSASVVLLASVVPTVSARFFDDPHLSGITPVTITDDGRIFGHLAAWGTCHIGIAGTCVTPPHSASDYAHFRTGAVHTDEGEIAVGHITLGTGHAGPGLSASPAAAHYDDTGTVAADVVAGEDVFGIWISGRVRDHLSDEDRYALASAPLSGDWRGPEGNREMIAALAVNVPGFLVPRVGIKGGRQISLVAAGMIDRSPHVVTGLDLSAAIMVAVDEIEFRKNRRAMAKLASEAGRTPAAKMERLREMARN